MTALLGPGGQSISEGSCRIGFARLRRQALISQERDKRAEELLRHREWVKHTKTDTEVVGCCLPG